ncbi:MAG: polysaccharide deacetylase family protein, partial [Candidatus Parcubacteria bacterium]|nr:polysaccharide deacetylase family protein [Candidatus Parcubacteria bacterium]
MKFDWLKSRHHLFDLFIAILIIAVVVLADILVVKLKSNPGEERERLDLKGQEKNMESVEIQVGQKVFIPILNFHHIDKAPANLSNFDKGFYIEPAKFEDILNRLIAADYRPVFTSEIVKYLGDKKLPQEKIMAITFDDGNEDFYTQAWPILQKLKIKSNVYIMTGVKGKSWLTTEQIVELDKSGLVEIGSHTVWHPYLKRVSKERQWQELNDSKIYLDKLLNKSINIIC